MMKAPTYKEGDVVKFKCDDKEITGKVYIVDAYGTFEQHEEPSYDVLCEEKNVLYKHIRESSCSKA